MGIKNECGSGAGTFVEVGTMAEDNTAGRDLGADIVPRSGLVSSQAAYVRVSATCYSTEFLE